ncbi:MAG: hypothetical protein WC533_01290 [Candidatus Pacearchaeota archaeon]
MKQKIFFAVAILSLLSLVVFVSAIQKEMNFPGTTITGEFVQQNMQFGKGWNLVQGILNPEWIQTNSDNIKAIYAYNPTTDEYVRFYPEPENNKIGDTNFAWSTWGRFGSLWVYSETDFNSNYWRFEDGMLSQTPLFSGWNFMAFTPEMSGQTFNQIKGNCNIEDIYLWNYAGQEWSDEASPKRQTSNLDKPIDDDFEGYGFIIKVTSDCTLGTSGSSTVPELPNIPN